MNVPIYISLYLVLLRRVTRRDRVIRDHGKVRALVKPVRASRCSRVAQKKSEVGDKSEPRRARRVVPACGFKTLRTPVF